MVFGSITSKLIDLKEKSSTYLGHFRFLIIILGLADTSKLELMDIRSMKSDFYKGIQYASFVFIWHVMVF